MTRRRTVSASRRFPIGPGATCSRRGYVCTRPPRARTTHRSDNRTRSGPGGSLASGGLSACGTGTGPNRRPARYESAGHDTSTSRKVPGPRARDVSPPAVRGRNRLGGPGTELLCGPRGRRIPGLRLVVQVKLMQTRIRTACCAHRQRWRDTLKTSVDIILSGTSILNIYLNGLKKLKTSGLGLRYFIATMIASTKYTS